VRLLFAIILIALALVLVAVVLLVRPAWSATHCLTYEEKTPGRPHTVCDDGTRAISTDNRTLERWETPITASPKTACTGPMPPPTSLPTPPRTTPRLCTSPLTPDEEHWPHVY
jgi:hypothetical protein